MNSAGSWYAKAWVLAGLVMMVAVAAAEEPVARDSAASQPAVSPPTAGASASPAAADPTPKANADAVPAPAAAEASTAATATPTETPPSAPSAATPPPTAQADAPPGELPGSSWPVAMRSMFGAHQTFADTLQFDHERLTSTKMAADGYAPARYTLSDARSGAVVWDATQINPQRGIALWHGELLGRALSGTLSIQPIDGTSEDYEFVNELAGAQAAKPAAPRARGWRRNRESVAPPSVSLEPAPAAAPAPAPASAREAAPKKKTRKGLFGF